MTNKRREMKDYAFIDKKGNKVPNDRDSYNAFMAKKTTEYGEAYALFYCEASEGQFKAELPSIRSLVKTPSKLEINLNGDVKEDGPKNLEMIKQFVAFTNEASKEGCNYALQARLPGGSNIEAAKEVTAILNQAYQSPLYKTGAEFKGGVFYEQNGRYVFAD